MAEEQGEVPLLQGRGVILIEDLCRAAGVDAASLEGLVRSGRIQGLVDADDELFGLFNDVLPSLEELRAMGVTVSNAYDVDALRSAELDNTEDDRDAPWDQSSTWTMAWDEDSDR